MNLNFIAYEDRLLYRSLVIALLEYISCKILAIFMIFNLILTENCWARYFLIS